MEGYEKRIGFKTIWLTIVRRFEYILFIFVPIALTSLIVTQFVLTKTYQSTVTVSLNANFSATSYKVFQNYVTNEEVLDQTVNKLQNDKNITTNISEITTGLLFDSPDGNSISANFSFQSSKKAIVQPVMEVLSDVVVNYAKEKDGQFASLSITTPATQARKNSSENKYLLIGLAAGLVVACAIPFIDEIISDEVYDAEDVKQLGCEGFELNISKMNK